jgi:hypothetical protein
MQINISKHKSQTFNFQEQEFSTFKNTSSRIFNLQEYEFKNFQPLRIKNKNLQLAPSFLNKLITTYQLYF